MRGAAPGERRGGRVKGTRNKATVERLERERILEQARQADIAGERYRNERKKLGKDVLEEFMLLFAGLAAHHQPLPPGVPVPQGRQPDVAKFEKWARLAVDTAAKLADFQSPKFKAIAVMAPQGSSQDAPRQPAGGDNVIPIGDAVAMSQVYRRRIQQVR